MRGLSRYMLGPYKIVEWGCDVPLANAPQQRPHRDFPMPEHTRRTGEFTSIAINASTIDVADHEGPFEFAPGTQFDPGDSFIGGMFPRDEERKYYASLMQQRLGKRGTFSARSGLTLHRGGASGVNARNRYTAIMGIVSPLDRAIIGRECDRGDNNVPRIRLSRQYLEYLQECHPGLAERLSYEVVAETTEKLPRYRTYHTFEGLIMGNDPEAD